MNIYPELTIPENHHPTSRSVCRKEAWVPHLRNGGWGVGRVWLGRKLMGVGGVCSVRSSRCVDLSDGMSAKCPARLAPQPSNIAITY